MAMGTWPPIDRDDLKNAAAAPGFDMALPLLVRRLIAETGDGVTALDMPGSTGTAAGGFDGVVSATGQTIEVPSGTSVWELSVTAKAQSKADDDYNKRFSGPDGLPTSSVTYVELILAPWTKARTWAATRSQEGRWKQVRAYNLDQVHAWLDRAPATSAWLAEQLGKRMPGVQLLDLWWSDTWLPSTRVPLGADLVLAGRQDPAKALLDLLASGRRVVTVGGGLAADELRAVVAAALDVLDHPAAAPLRARSLYVTDSDSLAQLIKQRHPLVIILSDAGLASDLPSGHAHQLVLPGPPGGVADATIPPIDGQAVEGILRTAGESWERASELGTLARRSLPALRRVLAHHPAALTPSWAKNPDIIRRRLLMLGGWDGDSQGDRTAVAQCTGHPYADVQDAALTLASATESPMLGHVDEQWHVLSPDDAWTLLSPHLTRDDINAYRDVTLSVLSAPDPLTGLDAGGRLSAQMAGTRRAHSNSLRQGVALTLALLGATEHVVPALGRRNGSDHARLIARELFDAANADRSYILWNSLADVLGLLAEAAPDEFLAAMRDRLGGSAPLHASMFSDSESDNAVLGGSASPHTEFLWALEAIAWSPDYFDDAVDVLGRLAALDPGGRWSNRPARSLAEILSCWHPNTSADEHQRLHALQRLLRDEPAIGRRLLLDLIPDGQGFQTAHGSPRFRAWRRETPIARAEIVRMASAVIDMLLADLSGDPECYVALTEKIDHVSPAHRARFAERVIALAASLDDEARVRVHEALRDKIAHHREYAHTAWALPDEELRVLDAAAAAVQPRSAVHQAAWLFASDWVTLGDLSRRDDRAAYDAAVRERRARAVGRALAEGGLASVFELAGGTPYPQLVGTALAEYTSGVDAEMVACLSLDDRIRSEMAFAYIARRLRSEGELCDALLRATRDPRAQAMILEATYDPPAAWGRFGRLDSAVAEEYWKRFSYSGLGDFAHVLQAVRGLLGAHRYAASIDLMALYEEKVDFPEAAQLAATALQGLLAGGLTDPELPRLSSHDYETVFALLARHRDAVGTRWVLNLEWQFFPALGFEANAPALHTALADDPAFFAEMVAYLYRRDDGAEGHAGETADDTGAPEQRRLFATRAFEVLRSWRRCPGAGPDGVVDPDRLRAWVADARSRLSAESRLGRGDSEIGQVVAFAQPDADGTFPSRSVRNLLEDVRSDQIERGLQLGIANKRGITSRGMYDGGKQEWDLAADARKQAEGAAPWPRTRRLLRDLAEGYERDARRYDEQAERRRRGLTD